MPSEFESGVTFAELTDIGMRRTNNQDSLVCVPSRSEETYQQRGHLFVVADGMGAHAAGELASRMATAQIAQHYSRLAESESIATALFESLARANGDIYARGQSNPEFHNMGTTACALVISPRGAMIGHVGDSRVYRMRGKTLQQMTFDHSLVWELEAGGQITAAGVANIPKNVITRSLGPSPSVNIDLEGPLEVEVGDRFLLCSDGLTGPVTDEEIAVLMHCLDEDVAARVLIDLANLRGGPDNISVILVTIKQRTTVKATRRLRSAGDPTIKTTLAVVGGLAVVASGILGVTTMYGPMVLALIVAVISGVLAMVLGDGTTSVDHDQIPEHHGGKGPYRQYPVRATAAMVHSLGETIEQLCKAADGRGWALDQTKIDQLRKKCRQQVDQSQWQKAIEIQAEAIIETMNQLRRQNNAAAAETATH